MVTWKEKPRGFFRQKMSGSYGVVEGQFDDVDDEVYDIYLCQMYILIFRVILNSFIQKSYLSLFMSVVFSYVVQYVQYSRLM